MAGAIAEVARQSLAMDFRHIDPTAARIVLIEAGPRIMPTLPTSLSDYVRRTLGKKGVEVMTSTRVTSCDMRGVALASEASGQRDNSISARAGHSPEAGSSARVTLEHGRLDAGTIIWAAGVVASPAASWLDAERDRAGRVKVAPDLSVPGHPEIFVIGDTAVVADQPGIPGTAPAAKQMGTYVASVIATRVAGQPAPPPFRYHHLGDLATIGRHAAVVKLGRLELTGFLGWLFWSVVHIYFLIGVRDRFIVAFTWLWDYLTFQRGARLITQVPPAEKR
jgi:NADH dehydrogenase